VASVFQEESIAAHPLEGSPHVEISFTRHTEGGSLLLYSVLSYVFALSTILFCAGAWIWIYLLILIPANAGILGLSALGMLTVSALSSGGVFSVQRRLQRIIIEEERISAALERRVDSEPDASRPDRRRLGAGGRAERIGE
jgi:hypothetical protein